MVIMLVAVAVLAAVVAGMRWKGVKVADVWRMVGWRAVLLERSPERMVVVGGVAVAILGAAVAWWSFTRRH